MENSRIAVALVLTLSSASCLLVACESGPRPTQEPETSLIGEPPAERPTKTAQQAPEVEEAPVEDDLRVELVMLEKGNPYKTDSGLVVRLRSESPVEVVMTGAEDEEVIVLDERATYAEGTAFGSTWSLSTDAGLHLNLRHDPPLPLTTEQAREVALRELDANLGCDGDIRSADAPRGTVRVVRVDDSGETVCSATVGLFTREVLSLQESQK